MRSCDCCEQQFDPIRICLIKNFFCSSGCVVKFAESQEIPPVWKQSLAYEMYKEETQCNKDNLKSQT